MGEQRIRIGAVADVPKNGMKAFTFTGQDDDATQVLISNLDGKLYATSAKCSEFCFTLTGNRLRPDTRNLAAHYGAPLANGVLTSSGRCVCPWHGAAFDVKSGDIEDAPGLDGILSLKLEVEGSDIHVTADPEKLKGKPGNAPGCAAPQIKSQGSGLVIVGGGAGAIHTIESARKSGYAERITVLSREPHVPIDRTKLSKGLITDHKAVQWRNKAHLENVLHVDFRQSARVISIDVEAKKVNVEGGDALSYDALVLATGGTPRRLPVDGAKEGQLGNVFTLRGLEDTNAIVSALGDKADKNLVVIGSSFIGCEGAIAAAGQEKAKSVSVVGMEEVPFERVLGSEVGAGLRTAAEKNNGVKFYMKSGVSRLEGDGGKVKCVVIKDESGKEVSLPADVVILGVGVAPATEWAKDSKGFPDLQKDGSVEVDVDFRVKGIAKDANVFAIGDIATYPTRDGKATTRIEHWNVASNHGRHVGHALAKPNLAPPQFDKLPVFWSALGSQLRYVSDGNGPGFDGVHLDGSPEELKFAAFYYKGDSITAVAT